MKNNNILKAALATTLLAGATAASAADFVLVNTDPPGIGFNDPTPATPVGGNAGTTVGEQRLIAYNRALQQWGSILKSNVPIVVLGGFGPRPCTATGGVLASAGAWNIEINFPNAPLASHWYHSALANSLAGVDLYPGADIIDGADIIATFNGNLGTPGCIEGSSWYYGLDNRPTAAGQIDFLNVFMHELSHGLGFQNFNDEATGNTFAGIPNFPDSNTALTRDNVLGKRWNTMTANEIRASAVRNGQVVWDGANVTARAPSVLGPLSAAKVTAPASVAGDYEYGDAAFGPAATSAKFTGAVVLGLDQAGVFGALDTVNDGCSALTNAADVAGKIVLMKRGTCGFAVKVKNAQNAGASAVVIGNNAAGVISMGGTDATITIPSIMLTNTVGDAMIAAGGGALNGVELSATLKAGADTAGRVRLYAPTTYAPGSSISHFDTVASPNLLMEPAITSTLRSSVTVDLTAAYFEDIGWKTELSVAGCGTGSGAFATMTNGTYLAAPVFACANAAPNKGQFQACSTQYFNRLRDAGIIDGAYKGTFAACAASGK
jgi:hypothetical protein